MAASVGFLGVLIIPFLLLGLFDMIRVMTTKSITQTATFQLPGIGRRGTGILVGHSITLNPDAGAHDMNEPREAWALKSGLYTPRQLVESFAPLLDTVVLRLGPDPPNVRSSRCQLLDNLAANLDTNTREASMRFPNEDLDDSRTEIADQARGIGKTLVQYARSHTGAVVNPDLYLRSPCEGHLLTKPNVDLMFGPRSEPHLMQLFNEYMHQMVLLRDALIPFKNYEDVVIPIDGQAARGMRYLEPSRSEFLVQLWTRQVSQSAVVKLAQALLAPSILAQNSRTTSGYGFQYAHGLVLPAVLAGGETPFHLLQYIAARLVEDATNDILFDYEMQDYYSARRMEISGAAATQAPASYPPGTESPAVQRATIEIRPAVSDSDSPTVPSRHLELRLELDNGRSISVDVGQVCRGHRYAYIAHQASSASIPENGIQTGTDDAKTSDVIVHDATSVLRSGEDGLVTAKGGLHIIPVQDPLVSLALMGVLYPENVVLLPMEERLEQAENSGKGLEPKFVLWGGVERGGLRGRFQYSIPT
ncbi:hypothetical protein ASPVEDRAFT_35115 [Aspergillus versicolor CBS 583.65]|uniref:Uncharacterized protein n=1 Tax=Aspergillus versicolor CBS 583.65 TaxID=1036611 RepID=A0A1L9P2Z3_ASPVE|nr:uncharacterized protein ASPVEDRAFT_35115 [Aspergillus versicolor CBS 583.65]OJI95793.1 hypothetical protein ASPVEDRAFT_35115 [Aspergillus versicolor CBS 583.65]